MCSRPTAVCLAKLAEQSHAAAMPPSAAEGGARGLELFRHDAHLDASATLERSAAGRTAVGQGGVLTAGGHHAMHHRTTKAGLEVAAAAFPRCVRLRK